MICGDNLWRQQKYILKRENSNRQISFYKICLLGIRKCKEKSTKGIRR